jgi:hypothetical protein
MTDAPRAPAVMAGLVLDKPGHDRGRRQVSLFRISLQATANAIRAMRGLANRTAGSRDSGFE